MKEFNLVLDKVSKALGMTVDNVVKLYPQLRKEWSWYYVLDNLNELAAVVLMIGTVALAFLAFGVLTEQGRIEYRVPLRISVGVIVLLAITCVVTMVLKGFMCPDILIIKEFLNNGK